ncbi:MAG: hypothetical protein ACI4DV_04060 [Lachnospiraceae bacterium]
MENFEMSDFIAGNCQIDVGFGDSGSNICTIPDPDFGGALTLFNVQGICDTVWIDGDDDDRGCYHIPDGGVGYFGS